MSETKVEGQTLPDSMATLTKSPVPVTAPTNEEMQQYQQGILLELGQCTLLALRNVFEKRCVTYEYPITVDGTNFIVQVRKSGKADPVPDPA